jgi:peptidoglycan/LPS O-acetylase OafA/YrhL
MTSQWLAFLPWYLVLTALSAYLLHRYVEDPVLRWRDRRLQMMSDATSRAVVARAA